MGQDSVQIRIVASLSNHNSQRDVTDHALWDELEKRLKVVVEDPLFEPINAWLC